MRLAGWLATWTVVFASSALMAGPPPAGRPLIVVADGAGDLKGCSNSVKSTARADGLAVDIEVFPWSHGHREVRKDQVDVAHARRQGEALATKLTDLRATRPGRPIILIGHSAGSGVILAAAERLPAGAVERIILLAPSVSSRHDLRPALRVARSGVDVFCSRKDVWALGVGVRLVGTADELRGRDAAGRVGFQPIIEGPGDRKLYQNLHQHFWTREDRSLGNDGHHLGAMAPDFLRRRILPLCVGRAAEDAAFRVTTP